ncbi:nucleotide pyrophosphatase [Rathayibacter iranicus]|uniref:Nucleotide pyrophosphatase n=2 Tax=Rathayibacter iranicus TaxID=59737 RepID=A0A5J6SKK0_9MICO|nr:nucleotide pyrophosphatase [Rathayibacter iranicus]MWV29961.1 nucleotide pyrophosphatase [Rathayibacter iranicus NCPPB 2253 = VKM Ac-1602]PPI51553.1 nucleotide pyrophosphatase [Rathayibacter iranicus]PPI63575.1 nucleotide pyrophosphatase [Rathayibacter iranicus]PPI74501.1 nucleotide pyrophosphatase [Rathayibacter iranicus]
MLPGTSKRQPSLVVLCVDGGKAAWVDEVGLGDFSQLFREKQSSDVYELATVFPSSTAPAHASFLTGLEPEDHGIVGNRFWEDESVRAIRNASNNPLLSIHAYENHSMYTSSLLNDLDSAGYSWAAVHFPHTFSTSSPLGSPSVYCIYAPSRTIVLGKDGSAKASVFFGEDVEFSFDSVTGRNSCVISVDGRAWYLGADMQRFQFSIEAGPLSVGARYRGNLEGPDVAIELGTSVLTLATPNFDAPSCKEDGPCSLAAEYSLGEGVSFFESPRIEWITFTALRAVEQFVPEVLFVRYNQVDHAQEFLYWYLINGNADQRLKARELLLSTYRKIAENIETLAKSFGHETKFLFFSDHGIDWVSKHVNPNVALKRLGLDHDAIFQGDSNCSYLYSERQIGVEDIGRIETFVKDHIPGVSVGSIGSNSQARSRSRRLGQMTLIAGSNLEFRYEQVGLIREVCSASHGDSPARSEMSGFFRTYGFDTGGITSVRSITQLREFIQRELNLGGLLP